MTLTLERDPDNVKLNQHIKYIGQRSSSSKLTHRHTLDRLLYMDH